MKLTKSVSVSGVFCLVATLFSSLYADAQTSRPSAALTEVRHSIQQALFAKYGTDQPISFVAARTKTGDAASGVVIKKIDASLALDTTPCVTEKTIVTFVAPYKESRVSDIKCPDNKTYGRVQVVQQ